MKRSTLLLSTLLLCISSYAQTETEPNNTKSQADAVGYYPFPTTLTNCYIAKNGDNDDIFKVKTNRGGVISAHIPANNSVVYFQINIIDSSTNNVITGGWVSSGNPLTQEAVVPAGTYYIHVFPWKSANDTNPYSIQLSFDTTDKCEWNNTKASACLVDENASISAKLRGNYPSSFPNQDFDYYKLTPTKCGILSVQMPLNSSNNRYLIKLIDSASNQSVNSVVSNIGGNVSLETAVSDNQSYYILVELYSGDLSNDIYTLNLSLDTTDTTECNNNIAEAFSVEICDSLTVSMRPEGDEDYYSFISNGNTIYANVGNVASNLAILLTAYDKNGQQIGNPISTNYGQPVSLVLTGSNTGETYYIKVSEYTNNANTQPYSFVVRDSLCGIVGIVQTSTAKYSFDISPNPSNGKFLIRLNDNKNDDAIMTITDVMGRIIKELQIQSDKDNYIELNKPSGLYIVTVQSESYKLTKKLMIN